jgi:hypothetical protein
VLSLEPELRSLHEQHRIDAVTAARLIARERRDVFSIYPELRICGWLGATLLASAAGVLLKNHLARVGPIGLAVLMGAAALACYAWTWFRRARATVIDDYILLLGALLVSADVAFIESQFRLFGPAWKRHLLLLAVVHAAGAYAYGSRMLLSLSITALAGWLGFERGGAPRDLTVPAFLCAACLIAWREVDRRVHETTFSRTFEHFAANIAVAGALTLLDRDVNLGSIVTFAVALMVIAWGFRQRPALQGEAFVLYGFLYAVIAVDVFLINIVDDLTAAIFIITVSMIAAVATLLALHARFKRATPASRSAPEGE